jgi:hypothetical protein
MRIQLSDALREIAIVLDLWPAGRCGNGHA